MASLFDIFINFREVVTGDKYESPVSSNNNTLEERINKMAADLSALIAEVNRVSEVQSKAMDIIKSLVVDVKSIATTLEQKSIEAENSVDLALINDLISKLKNSNDALSTTLEITSKTGQ